MSPTIGEYLQRNALRILSEKERTETRCWTAIFPRPKKESGKIRVITDMRPLNRCTQVPKHRAARWTDLLDTIRHHESRWAISFDLKIFTTIFDFDQKRGGGYASRWARKRTSASGCLSGGR